MTKLEQTVMDKLVEKMDIDTSNLEAFDENSPIFASQTEDGEASMDLDSIDALELAVMIEREWGLKEISAEDMLTFRTVKAIASYIESHAGEQI